LFIGRFPGLPDSPGHLTGALRPALQRGIASPVAGGAPDPHGSFVASQTGGTNNKENDDQQDEVSGGILVPAGIQD